jgi:putative ABC transport system ATP-binding protein
MLEVEGVHKSYVRSGASGRTEVHALRGATMRCEQPGFYAIMGASGSGKSTLLHLLAAMDRPDAGSIRVDGRALEGLSEAQLTAYRRTRVGVVFQQFNLIPTLTARENVLLPALLGDDTSAQTRARAGELLEMLGVSQRADHRPDALSGGEQQRVAIARALLYKPPLILADEPTGALDSRNAELLWALLARTAAEQQTTVVMVTHEPAAAAHCRRVFVLTDGVIKGSFETGDGGAQPDARSVAFSYQQLVG